MLGGFSLGIIVAGGVYVYGRLPPLESTDAAVGITSDTTAPAVTSTAGQVAQPASVPAPSANDEAAALADEAAVEATQFDFYDVLPEFEVTVPESATERGRTIESEALARSGNFVVQVGSFRTAMDADRRQAELALLGFESTVQRVAIDDDVYHRVRIGPITDLAELNRVRRRLRDEHIEYLLIAGR